jgi:hypothetical protein
MDADNVPGLAAQTSCYVHHFHSYDRTYGALGAFVVLMVWTYITSLLVLVGAEINCELHRMRSEAKSQAIESWRTLPGGFPVLLRTEVRGLLVRTLSLQSKGGNHGGERRITVGFH